MNTDIATIEKMNPVEIFQGDQLDPILKAIEKEVKSEVPDVKTVKGRDRIKSLAHKVARTKTTIDDMGKNLVSEWKSKSKLVDASRKSARDFLDGLKEDIRRPVTEWEEAEKARVFLIESRIETIKGFAVGSDEYDIELSASDLTKKLEELKSTPVDKSFEEFSNEAAQAKDASISALESLIEKRSKFEEEQAELARLRAEAAERERIEHEEKIAKEAAEAERIKAEEAIKAAEEEKQAAERRLIEQKEESERQRIEDAEKAEREKQAAIDEEQRRQHEQKLREQQEIENREANIKHCKKINNEALACFEKGGLSKADSKLAVELIAKKMIANVSISY